MYGKSGGGRNFGVVLNYCKRKVSVLNLFFKYYCIIINCFTLVFNGFDGKPYLKENNEFSKQTMVLI